jgi:hypothetical protein
MPLPPGFGGSQSGGVEIPGFGFVPTGFLDAILPFLQAQITSQGVQQGNVQSGLNAQTSANASITNANTTAGASVTNANTAAQGGIQQQLIQAAQLMQSLQAEIDRDFALANAGDQNAAHRLEAELKLRAQVANAANRTQFGLGLVDSAGKTGLRDVLTSRRFARGLGGQAMFGSALGGLSLDQLLGNVQAGPVDFTAAENNVNVGSLDPNNFQLTPGVFSGGGSQVGASTAGFGSFPSIGINFNDQLAQQSSAGAALDPNSNFRDLTGAITGQGPSPFPNFAHGGRIHSGNSGIVGEQGPEIARANPDGSVDIIPMKLPRFAEGGTIPAQSSSPSSGGVFEALFNDPNTSITQAPAAPAGAAPAVQQASQDPAVAIAGGGAQQGTPTGFQAGTGVQQSFNTTDTSAPFIPGTEPLTGHELDIANRSNPLFSQGPLGSLNTATSSTATGSDVLNSPGVSTFLSEQHGGFGAPIQGGINIEEEGIKNLPDPFERASTFIQMNRQDQEDVIQLYEIAGFTREDFWARIFEALPGNRGPLAALQANSAIGF